MKNIFLALILFILFHKVSFTQSLTTMEGGVTQNGNVLAIEYDATNNYLYIAGEMRAVDGVHVGNIARWDGTTWTSLNGGMNGVVSSLKLIGNKLFAGGNFQNAGGVPVQNIAYWDGTTWLPVGVGLNDPVSSLEFFNNTLYATAFALNTKLYAFDGNNWNFSSIQFNWDVIGMKASDSTMYIYGNFSKVNSDTAYGLLSFNGNSFYIYPASNNYGIHSLVLKDSTVYVAGSDWKISKWLNGSWQTFTTTPNPEDIQFIYNYNDTLYAVSDSGSRGSVLHIRKVVNGIFQPPTARIVTTYYLSERVNTVRSSGNKLFIGSDLVHFGDSLSMCLFHYDGNNWSNPGKPSASSVLGLFNYSVVNCMLKDSITGDIIAGGRFFFAGEKYCANVARWDGTQWNPMGDGLSNTVRKLLYFNNEIYAVGYFGRSGGNWVGRVAKWNGTSWEAVGTGADSGISDAIVYRNELYVGGIFNTLNGVAAKYCAKYDGTNWSSVGMNNPTDGILQFCVFNDTLIAGLQDWQGSSSTKYMRLINGSWYPMGIQTHYIHEVSSFLVFNNKLYSAAEYGVGIIISQWNDTAWQYMDTIVSTYINNGHVFNFHNQLAASCSYGFYLYDGTSFNKVSNIRPYTILNESPVKDYIGGQFGNITFGTSSIEINHIGSLDFTLPQISLTLNEDTICERLYGFYNTSTQDIFTTTQWHFTGGFPDTLSNVWQPIIQYMYPGNFSGYLVATNLVGTDTIFFSSDITVLPCIVSASEISTSAISGPFPNPFISKLSMTGIENLNEIFISDITGHTIKKWLNPTENEFDLADLSSGIYILTCVSKNHSQSFKIFKQ